MSEYVRVPREEWAKFLQQNELLIQRFEGLASKVKQLTQENAELRQNAQAAEDRVRSNDAKLGAEFKDAGRILQKQLSEISRVLELTETS